MNIEKLRSILNSGLPEEVIKSEVINFLAKDENVIPTIMLILQSEREIKKEISENMNLLLSKAHTIIETPELNKNSFMQKEIIAFYTKYKAHVGHCFKNLFS